MRSGSGQEEGAQAPDVAQEPPPEARPQMAGVRRVTLEDGRYLIFYTFDTRRLQGKDQ